MNVDAVAQVAAEAQSALARIETSMRASALPSLAEVAGAAYAAGAAAAMRRVAECWEEIDSQWRPPDALTWEQRVADRIRDMEASADAWHAAHGTEPWYGAERGYDPAT